MPRNFTEPWFLMYCRALAPITEAPFDYNVWAAISMIGGVLKNNVYINYGTFTIKPNQYIVLTGPPGIGKGTAMSMPIKMAKDLKLINDISDRVTAPKIIQKIADGFPKTTVVAGKVITGTDSSATLVSTELPTLLGASDWMLPFLCDAWDRSEFNYDTKNSGTSVISGMCVSLIGGCVPDFIRRLNKDVTAAINGGFTARTIFVYADKKSQNLIWPKSFEEHAGASFITELKEDLEHIAGLRGEVGISAAAYITFENFKKKLVPEDDESDLLVNFKSRMHVHVLKLAMVWCVARDDSMMISRGDMEGAIFMVTKVMDNLEKTFRGVGESDIAEGTARVQDFIEKKGATTRNEILKSLHRHISPENLYRILLVLENIGFFDYVSVGGKTLIRFRNVPAVKAAGPTPAVLVPDPPTKTANINITQVN
jgi:hypothetical protein